MKRPRIKTALVIAALLSLTGLFAMACRSPGPSSASPVTTLPASAESPSYEVLVKGEFVDPSIPRITAEDLKQRLDRADKFILIDNRTEYKFKMGHLPGAVNITNAVDSPYPDAEATMEKQLAALPDDTLKILYCD